MNKQKKRGNGCRKKILSCFLAGAMIALSDPAGICGSGFTGSCYAAEMPAANTYDEIICEIIRATNEERARYGLPALKTDTDMAVAANIRAAEQELLFSHMRPDGSRCFTVFAQLGIMGNYRGENLARGQICAAKRVVDAWMNSDGHRKNILNSRFTRIGVGYVESGTSGYWCQLFANE